MTSGRDQEGSRRLHDLLGSGAYVGTTDGHLLRLFAETGGVGAERAFAVLVERHGPLVLRACRSILRDEGAADDAFQATFLVLARKAGTIRVHGSLTPWLYRVARRIAIRSARVEADRRHAELRAAEAWMRPGPAVSPGLDADDLAAVFDEIDGLPGGQRSAMILCDLEGCTHERAAALLGWPVGTVKSRLSRARSRLRTRAWPGAGSSRRRVPSFSALPHSVQGASSLRPRRSRPSYVPRRSSRRVLSRRPRRSRPQPLRSQMETYRPCRRT